MNPFARSFDPMLQRLAEWGDRCRQSRMLIATSERSHNHILSHLSALLASSCCATLVLAGAAAGQTIVTGVQTQTGPSGTTITTTQATGVAAATAQAQAATAEIGAATAAVPGSGIAPTTTPGAGAGTEEGTLLVAPATKVAAHYLTGTALNGKHSVLVFVGGAAVPDVSAWLYFKNQTGRLASNLATHTQALEDLLKAPEPGSHRPALAGPAPDNMHMAMTPAFLAAALIPKILSYGYTSYQSSGIGLTVDDYMMDVALLEFDDTHSWKLYNQQLSLTLPDEISTPLSDLDTSAADASADIITAQGKVAAYQAKNFKDRPEYASAAAKLAVAITTLATDITNYSAFVSSLGNNANGVTWSTLLQSYAIDHALEEKGGGGVAFIKVHSAAVGAMTKSNLWTNLGAMPLYTSMGMVVSYVYYSPQPTHQDVESHSPVVSGPTPQAPKPLNLSIAGIFEVMTPYQKVNTVPKALALDSDGTCVGARTSRDSAKYCPIIYDYRRPPQGSGQPAQGSAESHAQSPSSAP